MKKETGSKGDKKMSAKQMSAKQVAIEQDVDVLLKEMAAAVDHIRRVRGEERGRLHLASRRIAQLARRIYAITRGKDKEP